MNGEQDRLPALLGGVYGANDIASRGVAARKEIPALLQESSKAKEEAEISKFRAEQGVQRRVADVEKGVAEKSRVAAGELETGIKPYQEFQQSEYKASDYAANAAARLFTGLMIGGVAKTSAIGQLKAVRDMQKAEDQGLKEQFTAAKIQFDEAEKARKDFNDNLKQRFDRMMKLLSTDRSAALAEAKIIESSLGEGAIRATFRAGDWQKAEDLFNKFTDTADKLQMAKETARIRAENRQGGAGQVFFGTDAQGNQVPVLVDPRTGKASKVDLPEGVSKIEKPGARGQAGQNALTFASRVYGNIENAAQDIQNIVNLPAASQLPVLSGLLNVDRKTAIGSLESLAARKITDKENRAFQQVTDQLGFALSRLEAQGLASGATKAAVDAFNSLRPAAGDNAINMAIYLARVKQEIQTGIKVHEKMPGATPEQKAAAKDVLAKLDAAVPFTVNDTLDILRKNKRPLGDKMTKLIQGPSVSNAVSTIVEQQSQPRSENAPVTPAAETVTVGDKVYTRPENFTDEQWSRYKSSIKVNQ